jgi:hypothetical protein
MQLAREHRPVRSTAHVGKPVLHEATG